MARSQFSSGMSMLRESTPTSTTLTALALPACSASGMASSAVTSASSRRRASMLDGYSAAPVMTGMGGVRWVLVMSRPSFFR